MPNATAATTATAAAIPAWVPALLLGLVWLGWKQTRPRTVRPAVVGGIALGMLVFSLAGVIRAFGADAAALAAWGAGLATVLALGAAGWAPPWAAVTRSATGAPAGQLGADGTAADGVCRQVCAGHRGGHALTAAGGCGLCDRPLRAAGGRQWRVRGAGAGGAALCSAPPDRGVNLVSVLRYAQARPWPIVDALEVAGIRGCADVQADPAAAHSAPSMTSVKALETAMPRPGPVNPSPRPAAGAVLLLVATRKGAWLLRTARTSWATPSATCAGPARRPHAAGRSQDRPPGADDLPLHQPGPHLEGGAAAAGLRQAHRRLPGRSVDHTFWLTPGHASERGTWYAGTSPQGLFRSRTAATAGSRCPPSTTTRSSASGWARCRTARPTARSCIRSSSTRATRAPLLRHVRRRRARVARRRPQLATLIKGWRWWKGFDASNVSFHDPHCVRLCPANPDRLYQQNHCGIYRARPARRAFGRHLAAHRPQDAQAGGRHRLPDGRAPARRRHGLGLPDGRHHRLATHQPRRPPGGLRHAQRRPHLAAAGPGPAREPGLVDREAPGDDGRRAGGGRRCTWAPPAANCGSGATRAQRWSNIARHLPEIYAFGGQAHGDRLRSGW
jgi:hypothetical protein